MAKDKDQQAVDEEEDNKPDETILHKEERDPDEAVLAEQAIHHYASEVLDQFRDQVEMAMSTVEAFLQSQTQSDAFNDRNFLEEFGGTFMQHAMSMFGGHSSPIAQAVFPMLDGMVDQSARECQAQSFVHNLSTALRDATWYLRDNLQSVLSGQWDELRDLAYEGSTDFVAALHAYGLPEVNMDTTALSQPLMDHAQGYLKELPKEKEESVEQDQQAQFENEEQKVAEDPAMQDMLLEEEKTSTV